MTEEIDAPIWELVSSTIYLPEGVVQDGVTVFYERSYISNGDLYRIRDVKGETRWIECQYAIKDEKGNTLWLPFPEGTRPPEAYEKAT